MPVVKLGASRQVVIPKQLHDQLGLAAGDYLEVQVQDGKVVFTPKALVDKRLDEGLADIREGRVHGPFTSARDMMRSLRGSAPPRSARKG